jgi:gamma-glutamyltranspeptidase
MENATFDYKDLKIISMSPPSSGEFVWQKYLK